MEPICSSFSSAIDRNTLYIAFVCKLPKKPSFRTQGEKKSVSHHWGYVAILCAALLFGISITANKILLESISPLMIASITYIVAGTFLGAISFLPQKTKLTSFLKLPGNT